MNVIIVGCGRVGYIIAEHLSKESHDVTLVDTNEAKLAPALANLDVQAVVGNGTTFSALKDAGVKSADILIAVTSEDEMNMISCMIAKKANPLCSTIARVRKPEYLPERNFFKNAIGMSMIINPELAAAKEIYSLISIPNALEVDSFANGRVELLKVKVTADSVLNGLKVLEISKKFDRKVLICIHVHDGNISIPNAGTVLTEGDVISVILPKSYISTFYNTVSNSSLKSIKDVMIAGGGTTGYYLAEMLSDAGINVKVIESDHNRCQLLSSQLSRVEVIHGDAENRDTLLENGLESMDAFVALTTVDEENIFLSLYANKVAPECKQITRIQKLQKDDIIASLPLGSIVIPRELTAEYILQHVRASMGSAKGSNVEALYELMDGAVEGLEFSISEESEVLNVPLAQLSIKPQILVAAIVRGKKIITPSGSDMIQLNDTVVIVTTIKGLNDIRDILN
ncbi:MAG: Trk system potassium transporter TrkA [Lachnospiraceae bacterium]|nr:Trk system potassium transporter TrkA [Lachnospiraceae bacterium]